jgi:hypothetical protein
MFDYKLHLNNKNYKENLLGISFVVEVMLFYISVELHLQGYFIGVFTHRTVI